MKRRRLWKALAWTALVLALLASGVFYALARSERALEWAFHWAAQAVPGELTATSVSGRLLGPIRVEGLAYRAEGTTIRLGEGYLDWQATALLAGILRIHYLRLTDLDVTVDGKPGGETPAPGPALGPLPAVVLPLHVRLAAVSVDGLRIRTPDPVEITHLRFALTFSGSSLLLHELALSSPLGELNGRGRIRFTGDYPLRWQGGWSVQAPGPRPVAGHGTIDGNLQRLRTRQELTTPVSAQIDGQATDLLGEPRWVGTVSVPGFRLPAIEPTWPDYPVAGTLQVDARPGQVTVEAGVQTTHPAVGDTEVDLRLQGMGPRWRIRSLQINPTDHPLTLQASGGVDASRPRVQLEGHWRALAWPLSGPARLASPQGELTLSGWLDDYDYRVAARLEGPRLPPGDWAISGQGTTQTARLEQITGQTLGGQVAGSGAVTWSPTLRWRSQVTVTGLDPGRQWPDWPGHLSGRATASGEHPPGEYRLELHVAELEGRLRDHPLQASGRVQATPQESRLERLSLQAGDTRVRAHGRLAEQWDFTWQANIPRVADWMDQAAGSVRAEGTLRGPRSAPRVAGSLHAEALAYGNVALEQLDGQARFALNGAQSGRIALAAQGIRLADRLIENATLEAQGTTARHEVALAVDSEALGRARLEAAAGWADASWDGEIQSLRWQTPALGTWASRQSAAFHIGARTARLDSLCLQQEAHSACLALDAQPPEWTGTWRLTALPLGLAEPWLPETLQASGEITGQGQWEMAGQGPVVVGDLRVGPGELHYAPVERPPLDVAYRSASTEFRLDSEALQQQLEITLIDETRLRAAGRLADPFNGKDEAPRAIALELAGALHSPALLSLAFPQVIWHQAEGELDLTVQGTLHQPRIAGRLALAEARAELPALGITLSEITLQATSRDDAVVDLQGSARSGPGELDIQGRLRLAQAWSADLQVRGQSFEVVNLPQAHALVTPELDIHMVPKTVTVRGSITVPEATLRPQTQSSATSASKDVVFVNAPDPRKTSAEPQAWAFDSEIRVVLGDKVRVDAENFQGRLTGALTVADHPDRLPSATGTVEVVDARYQAYGKKLPIEQGRLVFTGGALDNPTLDMQTVRRVGSIQAGARIAGTPRQPQMTLFSDPPMPDSQILSYLLTGRPLSQVDSSEAGILASAASTLGLAGGDRLAKQIGSAFGLEEVRVESGGGLQEASLAVGKYLSPRLYLTYSVGLFEPTNVFRIQYVLGKRWTLEAESGTQTGADLIYTIER